MATITLTIPDKIKSELKQFSWVNWSLVAKSDLKTKSIFEKYMAKEEFSEQDLAFCESTDWHPVDELPLKESFVKELKKVEKGAHIPMNNKKLDKLMGIE